MPTPVAPPRKKRGTSTSSITISSPYDFKHVSHIGPDFNPNDVKRAIRPGTLKPPTDRASSSISRSDSRDSNLGQSGKHEPPNFNAPIYVAPTPKPTQYDPYNQENFYDKLEDCATERRENVKEYENLPSSHIYENTVNHSTKLRPPPPPPLSQKYPLVPEDKPKMLPPEEVLDIGTIWRQPKPSLSSPVKEDPVEINTPVIMKRRSPPSSVAIDRPNFLEGNLLSLGLDDDVPKSRTPTPLTKVGSGTESFNQLPISSQKRVRAPIPPDFINIEKTSKPQTERAGGQLEQGEGYEVINSKPRASDNLPGGIIGSTVHISLTEEDPKRVDKSSNKQISTENGVEQEEKIATNMETSSDSITATSPHPGPIPKPRTRLSKTAGSPTEEPSNPYRTDMIETPILSEIKPIQVEPAVKDEISDDEDDVTVFRL